MRVAFGGRGGFDAISPGHKHAAFLDFDASTASCSLEPSVELGRLPSSFPSSLEPSLELPRFVSWQNSEVGHLSAVSNDWSCSAALAGGGTSVGLHAKRPRTPLTISRDHEDLVDAQSKLPYQGGDLPRPNPRLWAALNAEQGQSPTAAPVDSSSPELSAPRNIEPHLDDAVDAFEASSFHRDGKAQKGSGPRVRRLASLKRTIPTDLLAKCWEERQPTGGRSRHPLPTQRPHRDLNQLSVAVHAKAKKVMKRPAVQRYPSEKEVHNAVTEKQNRTYMRAPYLKKPPGANLEGIHRKLQQQMAVMTANLRKEQKRTAAGHSWNATDATAIFEDVETPRFKEQEENALADVSGTFTQSNVWKYSVRLKVPLDVLKVAADIFCEHCEIPKKHRASKFLKGDVDLLEDSHIDTDKFGAILCQIIGVDDEDALPEGMLQSCFQVADGNNDHTVGFEEFALWYSRFGFSEDVLLPLEQKELRKMARKFEMKITDVEYYKRCFDSFDSDGSGEVDAEEFSQLLAILLKIPPHMELQKQRVQQFWRETDIDGGGSITFDEFLLFYKKYFEKTSSKNGVANSGCALTEFYRSLRLVSVARH